ncbi:hypothetical protein CYMTET_51783 [Cymbomonas tetramitiformis]|uniref:Uncharacterized protein n=1 Tax=Cymbomonas tetramitiformis TaxID=36881 RepID=A0AAE0BLT7_9CHLO|nr:hypothetical protein CYMTET_51783 [Cymbomonas tetramitiformis]
MQTLMRRIQFNGSTVLDFGGDAKLEPQVVDAAMQQLRLSPSELCSARVPSEPPRPCLPKDTESGLCSFNCRGHLRKWGLMWPSGGAICAGRKDRPCAVRSKAYC